MACRSSLLGSRLAENKVVLGNASRLLGLSLFVLSHSSLLGVGLGLSIKWAEDVKFFGPTIAPQNPAIQLLGWKGGFWCPRAFIMACQVLSSINASPFTCLRHVPSALEYEACLH